MTPTITLWTDGDSDRGNLSAITRLKKKIENNSTWEGVFYQSEWVKINSTSVIFIFSLCVCGN